MMQYNEMRRVVNGLFVLAARYQLMLSMTVSCQKQSKCSAFKLVHASSADVIPTSLLYVDNICVE